MLPTFGTTAGQVVWALFAGPVAGLASVIYIRAISWADARKPSGFFWLLTVPLVVFGLLGGLAGPFPQLLGNGKDVVQQAFLGQIGIPLLVILVALKPMMTSACLGSGAPGGLFTPTLTCGHLLGAPLGRAWALVWPSAPPGSYAVIGAAAVLAAATQGPISAVVLLIELTRQLDTLMVPILFGVTGAVITTRYLEPRSIYSGRIHASRSAAAHPAGQSFCPLPVPHCTSLMRATPKDLCIVCGLLRTRRISLHTRPTSAVLNH